MQVRAFERYIPLISLLTEGATILSKPLPIYTIAHYFKVTFLRTGGMPMISPFTKGRQPLPPNYRLIFHLILLLGKSSQAYLKLHI